jgi:hypothetical protein
MVPFLIGNPDGFVIAFRHAANTGLGNITSPVSWWFVVAKTVRLHFQLGNGYPSKLTLYTLPAWVVESSHAFIVALTAGLAILMCRRTRRRDDALLVLGILFLLRCTLDPGDVVYYSVPLVLALLAWETLTRAQSLPFITLLTCVALWVSFDIMLPHAPAPATSLAYLSWTSSLLVYLIRQLTPGRREEVSRASRARRRGGALDWHSRI